VVWIKCLVQDELDRVTANASPDAPAIIGQRMQQFRSQSAIVAFALDEMEAVAARLFPAWLPLARGIATSAGAASAAVRTVAIAEAVRTGQYGSLLADLADGALAGRGPCTRMHPPEVRAAGLSRVLATSFGRSACVLLWQVLDELGEPEALALVGAAQWLVDHGQLGVWISGGSLPGVDWLPGVALAERVHDASSVESVPRITGAQLREPSEGCAEQRTKASARGPRRRAVTGKPHPASRAEVVLEAVLADRPWAAGRVWNHTVRPGPLVNPVRVDLLWKRERCIVEIDGDDHRTAGKYAEDRHRDVMLQLNGYAVLRFTNTQVLDDIENVLALLQQFLASRRKTGKGN
jgi:very-short-patch-repair endonuclease